MLTVMTVLLIVFISLISIHYLEVKAFQRFIDDSEFCIVYKTGFNPWRRCEVFKTYEEYEDYMKKTPVQKRMTMVVYVRTPRTDLAVMKRNAYLYQIRR